jgi:glutaredoxin 3
MPNVKIYSTPYCPYCILAKNYFNKNNIQFTEVNVDEDEAGKNEMIEKSGQMEVPVIEIGDVLLKSFNKSKIDELLGLK